MPVESSESSASYEGLFCLVCDYELAGLPSLRCPECGTPFDADALRVRQGDEAVPVRDCLGKKELSGGQVVIAAATAFLVGPARFARMLPKRSKPDTPIGFGVLTRVLAFLIGLGYAIACGEQYILYPVLLFIVASVVIDLCLATLCRWSCQTRPAYAFAGWDEWLWLLQYASIFLVFLFLLMVVLIELVPYVDMHSYPDAVLYTLTLLPWILVLTWWVYLALLIRGRCRGVGSALVAFLGIPICTIVVFVGLRIVVEFIF